MKTIKRIDVFPVRLPATRTFTFASGSTGSKGATAPHCFVKITDSDGVAGWGEGRPVPQWSYETLESVTTTIRKHLAPMLIGLPVSDRWGIHQRMHQAIGRGPSTGQPVAKAALDIAVHDLFAKAVGVPLRCLLGGSAERNRVELSFTLTGHSASEIRAEIADAKEKGFRQFNFKVAVSPKTDLEIAQAIREFAGPSSFIWADANQGFKLHEARLMAQAFAKAGVDVLEQPLAADQILQMRKLRKAVSMPLAIDEASVSPADFFHYATERLIDYLVVKITRSGGIWPSLQQIAVAESAGIPLLVSGLTDGLVTKLAVCQLAAAFGFEGPAALNGSQFIDENALFPRKSSIESGAFVTLPTCPGIGIEPDEAALAAFICPDLGPPLR